MVRENKKLHILYLASNNITGEKFGGQIRAFHIGEALKKIGIISMILVRRGEIIEDDINEEKRNYAEVIPIRLYEPLMDKGINYLKRNFSMGLDLAYGMVCSPEDKRNYIYLASKADLIWSHGARILSALGSQFMQKTFIDLDDIESQVIKTKARSERRIFKKAKLSVQAAVWRAREKKLVKKYGGIGVCSKADREYLGDKGNIYVIPNGFEKPKEIPKRRITKPARIGFIGRLDYLPNHDGLKWFIKKTWPLIKKEIEDCCIRVVGSGKLNQDEFKGKNIDILGYIHDTNEEMATWALMVVPIFVGGGTRIKIAEAFSRKIPIVSTRLGAYGYEIKDGKEILIADSAQEFAEKCIRILKSPAEGERIAEAAWTTFLEGYTWESIYKRVEHAVASLLELNTKNQGDTVQKGPS